MKRFYKTVTIAAENGHWHLLLDGKPIKMPEGHSIRFPTQAMAQRAQEEWAGQGETIDWATMPCTRLAGSATALTPEDAARMRSESLKYGGTDLLCYWAQEESLQSRQRAQWEPVIQWAEARFGIRFERTQGMMPVAQPEETISRMAEQLEGFQDYRLIIIAQLVPVLGSLILALALEARHLDAQAVIHLSQLDESWQAERWGEDAEAAAAREAKAKHIQELVMLLSIVL